MNEPLLVLPSFPLLGFICRIIDSLAVHKSAQIMLQDRLDLLLSQVSPLRSSLVRQQTFWKDRQSARFIRFRHEQVGTLYVSYLLSFACRAILCRVMQLPIHQLTCGISSWVLETFSGLALCSSRPLTQARRTIGQQTLL